MRKKSRKVRGGVGVFTNQDHVSLSMLLTGKFISATLRHEKLDEFGKAADCVVYDGTLFLKAFEDRGLIEGYIPVISAKGKKLMEMMEKKRPIWDGPGGVDMAIMNTDDVTGKGSPDKGVRTDDYPEEEQER